MRAGVIGVWCAATFVFVVSVAAMAQERPPTPEKASASGRPTSRVPATRELATPPPVEVRTSLNRTAVWVGDLVSYSIELRCAPQVDIVTEDLASERLKVDGLEIRDVVIDR